MRVCSATYMRDRRIGTEERRTTRVEAERAIAIFTHRTKKKRAEECLLVRFDIHLDLSFTLSMALAVMPYGVRLSDLTAISKPLRRVDAGTWLGSLSP